MRPNALIMSSGLIGGGVGLGFTSTTCSLTGTPYKRNLATIVFPLTVILISLSSKLISFPTEKFTLPDGISFSRILGLMIFVVALEIAALVICFGDFILINYKGLTYSL